jgi:hypothetical protein
MSRSPEYEQGNRAAIKWAITWLHERANEMNDPHARLVLNSAAFNMGVDTKRHPGPKEWPDTPVDR